MRRFLAGAVGFTVLAAGVPSCSGEDAPAAAPEDTPPCHFLAAYASPHGMDQCGCGSWADVMEGSFPEAVPTDSCADVPGPRHCCNFSEPDYCSCAEVGCNQDTPDYCMCDAWALDPTRGGTRVDVCNGPYCCAGAGIEELPMCKCSTEPCEPGFVQVAFCSVDTIECMDGGATVEECPAPAAP